ncbi:hypothetical protein XENTR_v10000832 [Xenopus tropicalis]|nr:hypothetical protein XENTR_v10000832 [Xenopus tropicalis]
MANNVNWIQRSSVPSFAQMLKKNLPAQAPAVNLSSTVSTCCPYVEPDCGTAKVTQITGFPQITFPEPFLSEMIVPASLSSLPPRKVTKEFVVKYRRGDLNPVSALYQFAQMQRMEIDLKETVTTAWNEAKANAAIRALDELLLHEDSELPDKRTFIHEKISSIIKETFTNLISKYPEYESCGSSLAAYFYRQLLLFYSGSNGMMDKSIFCTEPATNLLALKPNFNIFLYMNQLPKGAAQTNPQLLYFSVEGKNIPAAYYSGEIVHNLYSMSSADKRTRCEVLGVQ